MSNNSASNPQPDNQPAATTEFNVTKEHTEFLKDYLSQYWAYCTSLLEKAEGPRMVKNAKGEKKDWVLKTVFNPFVSRFYPDSESTPNLDSMRTKLVRWFTNHKAKSNTSASAPVPVKRPHATNAEHLFGKKEKVEITRLTGPVGPSAGTATKFDIAKFNNVRKTLYNNLSAHEKRTYESVIFENQVDIAEHSIRALQGLIGWERGQHGDVVFFVQGAFRNENNKLKLFDASIGPTTVPGIERFRNVVPDYDESVRKPFKAYAAKLLPVPDEIKKEVQRTQNPSDGVNSLLRYDDGFPRLPALDLDAVAPADARQLLKGYLEAAWNVSLPATHASTLDFPPWDLLNDPVQRRKVLKDSDKHLPNIKSLDYSRTNISDLFSVLFHIRNAQDAGKRIVDFIMSDIGTHSLGPSEWEENNIEEMADPSPRRRTSTSTPRGRQDLTENSSIVVRSSKGSRSTNPKTPHQLPDFSPDELPSVLSTSSAQLPLGPPPVPGTPQFAKQVVIPAIHNLNAAAAVAASSASQMRPPSITLSTGHSPPASPLQPSASMPVGSSNIPVDSASTSLAGLKRKANGGGAGKGRATKKQKKAETSQRNGTKDVNDGSGAGGRPETKQKKVAELPHRDKSRRIRSDSYVHSSVTVRK